MRWVAVALIILVAASMNAGCGGSSGSSSVVTAQPGSIQPFTLTLVNQTQSTLIPDPLTAEPNGLSAPPITLKPGDRAVISIGYLPSKITVGATVQGTNAVLSAVTLVLGTDYERTASDVTFTYK